MAAKQKKSPFSQQFKPCWLCGGYVFLGRRGR
eukprot:CAMPEP_0178909748 /NCGR_PEP_ID=MMETSP0786-20121207/8707_1 /TAXON_ID=186022 /ORGANISM="Thalassionema frauenfeldii, Strain CCMP 1798" /LENGTH=31 /DNA_ID= /DNA_START= /DNA_END= /DNA_ORIENTATION=